MERVPFKIWVTRFVGTFILRASSAALSPSSSSSSARCSPGWIAASAIEVLLVIIHNLHIGRPRRSGRPLEAHTPLVVYAYAVLAFAVAMQRFKTIAGQRGEVPQRHSRFQAVQFKARRPFKTRERLDAGSGSKVPGAFIPIAEDHPVRVTGITRYVKRNAGVESEGWKETSRA